MITKLQFGSPFFTGAVVKDIPVTAKAPEYLSFSDDSASFSFVLGKDDVIYGLGENMGSINKRGRIYVSNCTDDPVHTESKVSLYGAHNFYLVDGAVKYGIFVDFPAKVTFDIGFTDKDVLKVTVGEPDYMLYIIENSSLALIIREFRELIGESYIAPKWAFGYQQSRWGYMNEDDIRGVVAGYRDNNLPLDAVYMDIDYMDNYKDFTINDERFPDFAGFVKEMKAEGIHLVPIIDAGVKMEKGYDVYEEGCANDYFCKDADGNDFVTAVWPGKVHMPDFLNESASKWFGDKYSILIDYGIDGFWNDMNEPALFYSEKTLKDTLSTLKKYCDKDEFSLSDVWDFQGMVDGLANNPKDYESFYHNVNGKKIRHDKVHNLYGFNMTRSAAEAFKRNNPDQKMLLFSRSSYIGMHRYAGIWTGDNTSWWAHIELLMHMLPGLNMCGFIYTGADMGGFGGDSCEDLMMRFLELSMFTPLMRNHAAIGTREQELFRFKDLDSFRNLLNLRYALVPYLYSEYLKAIKNNTLMFSPLGVVFEKDETARHIEDQLMVGENIMITPVYQPNIAFRTVYLPENMTMLRMRSAKDYDYEALEKGWHTLKIALNEVLIFIRDLNVLILGDEAANINEVSTDNFTALGNGSSYTLYSDEDTVNILKF